MEKAAQVSDQAASRMADRLNYLPIMVFGLWLGPLPMLWLQLFGPLRPFAYAPPSSPAGPWFLAALFLGVAGLFLPSA